MVANVDKTNGGKKDNDFPSIIDKRDGFRLASLHGMRPFHFAGQTTNEFG
jgi:hypothetical protein